MGIKDLVLMNPNNPDADGRPVWFDTVTREYRKQIFCSSCGDSVGCLCYKDYETAVYTEDGMVCNKKECLIYSAFAYGDAIDILDESNCDCSRIPINECTSEELEELLEEYECIVRYWKAYWKASMFYEDEEQSGAFDREIQRISTRKKEINEMSAKDIDEIYNILIETDYCDLDGSLCDM